MSCNGAEVRRGCWILLELELKMSLSCHVGARDQTQVLCKSSQRSSPFRYLFQSPLQLEFLRQDLSLNLGIDLAKIG